MIMSRRSVSTLLVVLIIFSACASVGAQPRPKGVLVEKRVKDLGPLPFDRKIRAITLSPTGERLAYALTHKGQSYLVCDGKPGPAYDSVLGGGFSPNGRRLVYLASLKGSPRTRTRRLTFLVDDGKKLGQAYDSCSGIVFSPDSQRLAYGARKGSSRFVVCDGKEVFRATYGHAGLQVFSPDSRHLAFYAKSIYKGIHSLVCDGQTLPAWEGTAQGFHGDLPVFSPDSRRLVYAARRKGRWFLAQAALRDDKWVVPEKQPKGPTYERIFERYNSPVFSPDGKHLAFIARDRGKEVMVLDGKTVGTAGGIHFPQFSPDSGRLAYVAHWGQKQALVCDGKAGPAFEALDHPNLLYRFSPDSEHVAYIAWRGIKWEADKTSYTFRGAKWQVVCDGKVTPPITPPITARGGYPRSFRPQAPVFSPDSRHLAWFSTRGDKQFIVIDGVEGPKHAFVRIPRKPHVRAAKKVLGGGTNYPETDKLRYVIGDGKEAWLVEVDWPKGIDWTHGLNTVEH